MEARYAVVGGGLVGSLLAVVLAKKGYQVDLFERRSDPRTNAWTGGRSINLALSHRGLKAIQLAGLEKQVQKLCIPLSARGVHAPDGSFYRLPYGKEGQVINSVSRGDLNQLLLEEADFYDNITLHFNHTLSDADLTRGELEFTDKEGSKTTYTFTQIFGTDGAFSSLRGLMMRTPLFDFEYKQEYLTYGYKELHIPADEKGEHQLDNQCLHIWPRKNFMLMAMPNMDGSFTVTLYLAHDGLEDSFESIVEDQEIQTFFAKYFPPALALMPQVVEEYIANPVGSLVTISCTPWNMGGKVLLLGDAAHAIVPFYGQGMNAGFEDVELLSKLIDHHNATPNWREIMGEFSKERKQDTDAIAGLAARNFIEMRDLVADAHFLKKSKLDKRIASLFPLQWETLYSMVTFSSTPYSIAQRVGNEHDAILEHILSTEEGLETWLEDDEEARSRFAPYLG